MKFVLLLAVGAFAAQDVTPPVISLTFPEWVGNNGQYTYADGTTHDWEGTEERTVNSHALPTWYEALQNNATLTPAREKINKRASVTCLVGSTEKTCPDPSCSASDHHDTNVRCDEPRVVQISRSEADDKTHDPHPGYGESGAAGRGDDRIHGFSTTRTHPTSNLAGCTTQHTDGFAANHWYDPANSMPTDHPRGRTCVSRAVLGQYLVTYTAADTSGNQAEPVAFTFIFIDPIIPEFDFANNDLSNVGYTKAMKTWPDVTVSADTNNPQAGGDVWSSDPTEYPNANTWGKLKSEWSLEAFTAIAQHPANGGFGSQPLDSDVQIDARFTVNVGSPADTDKSKNLEAGDCKLLYGGAVGSNGQTTSDTRCTRSAPSDDTGSDNGKWNYDLGVTITDNYRDPSSMDVHARVQEGTYSTTLAWTKIDPASSTKSICMTPGTVVIDWYTDDQAGIFGWKHKSNPQAHRVQLTVTDNTRPVIHPCKGGQTTGECVTLRADQRRDTAATSYGGGSFGAAKCVAGDPTDDTTCGAHLSATDCHGEANKKCVWTETLAMTVSPCNANNKQADESGCKNTNAYGTTKCVYHKHRTFSNANGGKVSYGTTFTKCRAPEVNPSSASAEETSTILQCGKDSAGAFKDAYVEEGFTIFDNEDNIDADCSGYQEQRCKFDSAGAQHAGSTAVGTCVVDNAIMSTNNHLISAATLTAFRDDYTVTYRYTDFAGNIAHPVTRKVVMVDTVAPTLKLTGDCVIQNSAGAHVNAHVNNTVGAGGDDAADMASTSGGLFDHNAIAKYFTHRDDCDREVVTQVSLHEGGCNWAAGTTGTAAGDVNCHGSATGDKVGCEDDASGDDCLLGVFKWGGLESDISPGTDQMGTTGAAAGYGTSRHQQFHEYIAGTYAVQYRTEDASGHVQTACREIQNVDHTYPIIQILGSDQMTLEATHQGNYIDDGATCSDQVDGVISQNVEVSGDVVNLSKVGTYTITYNCKDSANNAAPAAQRTVVVAQTSCPKCTVHGASHGVVVHEASFPYSDAGAECSDVIDGDVTTLCFTASWTNGGVQPTPTDTDVTPKDQFDGGVAWGANEGYCDCGGIQAPSTCTSTQGCKWHTYKACNAGGFITSAASNKHVGAQIGTYLITYRAKNTVGLYNDGANCRGGAQHYTRSVIVRDTLRPVITLKYQNTKVAQGSVGHDATRLDAEGWKTDSNTYETITRDINPAVTASGSYPADDTYTNQGSFADDSSRHPAMMAEENTSAVNGWVIGAIASAVAGLALLGYSTRRTAVATSVPV